MRLPILSIQDVAERQLCLGCGACASVEPDRIEMIDVFDHGRRPRMKCAVDGDERMSDAMRVCPGVDQSHEFDRANPELIRELLPSWGPILQMWEGHAADEEIRFGGSSGGAASAIALYCIEREGMHGVVHTAARDDAPYLNRTVMSRTREELVARTGSRYAPASPCDSLHLITDALSPCVFIGKPCDNVALRKARKLRPELDRNVGLMIGFFCAGTPTTKGTFELLRRMGVEDPRTIRSLRYRGNGWPGRATVVHEVDGMERTDSLSYQESWGEVLSRHKQWRCNLCPDRTGEFADVAVGDPWYGGIPDDAPGRSLILARTARGRDIIQKAIDAGYLIAAPAENWKLPKSQVGFPELRGSIWGRLLALRLVGAPRPTYAGFAFFRHWLRLLPLGEKFKCVLGAMKRVRTRQLLSRQQMTEYRPEHTAAASSTATADQSCRVESAC